MRSRVRRSSFLIAVTSAVLFAIACGGDQHEDDVDLTREALSVEAGMAANGPAPAAALPAAFQQRCPVATPPWLTSSSADAGTAIADADPAGAPSDDASAGPAPEAGSPGRLQHVVPAGEATIADNSGHFSASFPGAQGVGPQVVFASSGNDFTSLQDTKTGISVGFRLAHGSHAPGSVKDGFILYPGAGPKGADSVVRPKRDGVEDHVALPADPGEIVYEVQLGGPVAGLRLVSDTLELLDASGDPRLRMSPPAVMGSDCVQLPVHVALQGCSADSSSAPPWGRSVTPPGATTCEVHLTLPAATQYPALLDPSWSSTGSLISPRYAHFGVALPNGNVLVGGGSNSWMDYTSAELYSTSAGTWAAAGNMSAGRQGGWGVVVPVAIGTHSQGAVLAAGGWTTSNNTVDAYDLSSGTWSTFHTTTARRGAAIAYEPTSGTVLVSGGDNTAEKYTISNNTWLATPLMPSAHLAHTSTAMPNGTILVAGSYDFASPGHYSAAAESYSPSTNAWTTLHAMTTASAFHSATLLPNGTLLIASGPAGTAAQVYTPSTNTWGSLSGYPNTYQQSGIALLTGGRLGVAGGHNGTNSFNDTWLYGTSSGTWTSVPISPLFNLRAVFPLVPISGGRALAPGGLQLLGGTIYAQTTSSTLFDDCNDDNVCTTDTLSSGVCTHTPVAGIDDGNPCTTDLCDPVSGQVTHGAANAGISCSTNACLANQTCDGVGACSGGTAASIDDGNPCTTDTCDPTLGPQHSLLPTGAACDDGIACNGTDTCFNQHSASTCTLHSGNLAAGTACDDKNPCTTADQCNGNGSCAGTTFTDTISADGCTKTTCTTSLGLTVGAAPDAGAGCAADAGVAASTPLGEVSDLANDIPTFTTNQGIDASLLYPNQISVIRGQVFFAPTIANSTNALVPAANATVTAPGQPYGTATVRSDGWFDLAVNGGGPIVIRVAGPSVGTTYLSVERQAMTRWKEFTVLNQIVLTPQENVIAVTAPTSAPQMVAAGTSPADDASQRTPRVFFPQGLLANGSAVTSNFNLNVTEYTRGASGGPSAMPGDLPSTSGYTYAVAISMSTYPSPFFPSASSSGPTPVFYLDNFTGLQVGQVVPSGSYNTSTHQWQATTTTDAHLTGRVIKVVSVVNGDAQLDVDGVAGQPNSGIDNVDCSNPANSSALFCQMGFNPGETTKLGGVTPSLVGQTLWRAPLPHFSDWDLNWGFAAPLAAIFSTGATPNTNAAIDDACTKKSSIIECQNQILGEEVAVPGTPYSLSYRSDRQIGRKATIRVPLTDATTTLPTVAQGFKRIDATIDVAGNRFPYSTTSRANNQVFVYAWDRKDAYGRPVQGETTATVHVGYVYQGQTQNTAKFAAYGTGQITGDRAAREITLWNTYRIDIAGLDATSLGLGGWTISPQHVYEPVSGVTFFGDGERRHVEALVPTMRTVAGSCQGSPPSCSTNLSDGIAPLAALLDSPSYLAYGPDGTLYISISNAVRAVSVGASPQITTIAGGGATAGFTNTVPATSISMSPQQLVVAPDGSLVVADHANHRILRLTKSGSSWNATHIAGTDVAAGTPGQGDGGPATSAQLTSPTAVTVAADGTVYFGDATGTSPHIRRVGPDGVVDSVVGSTPVTPFPGNAGSVAVSAPSALLTGTLTDFEMGPDGNLYFVTNGVVARLVQANGGSLVDRFAGGGANNGNGDPSKTDGYLARDVALSATGFAFDREGRLYITESNQRVRTVGQDLVIHTYAGVLYKDGGLADVVQASGLPARPADSSASDGTKASLLSGPTGVTAAPNGDVCLVDSGHKLIRCIRRVDTAINSSDYLVPDPSASVVYQFDGGGKHLKTMNAKTGATLLTLGYDASNRLNTLTDAYGNQTTIERGIGSPVDKTKVTITARQLDSGNAQAAAQVTTLTLSGAYDDPTSYITSIVGPIATEEVDLTYYTDGAPLNGLLKTLTDPSGGIHNFAFSANGLLSNDKDPTSGTNGSSLARTDTTNGFSVAFTSPMGQVTSYVVDHTSSGLANADLLESRTVTDPAGLMSSIVTNTKGQTTLTLPGGGTTVVTSMVADPRLGMAAAYPATVVTSTGTHHDATAVTRTQTRSAAPSDPQNIFTEPSIVDKVIWSNSARTTTRTYTPPSRPAPPATSTAGTIVTTTGLGRTVTTTLDLNDTADMRPLKVNYGGLDDINFSYDSQGRISYVQQGIHKYAYTYFGASDTATKRGYVKSVTESSTASGGISIANNFDRDADGRATTITLPDSSSVTVNFLATGDVQNVTTPKSYVHNFGYNAADFFQSYTAPDVNGIPRATEYGYDNDGRLLSMATPSGTLRVAYDTAGRPVTASHPLATATTSYNPTTGQVASLNTSLNTGDSINLAYTYDGLLPTDIASSGPGSLPSHTVHWAYDNLLQRNNRTIDSGNAIGVTYDDDGFITSLGSAINYSYSSQPDGGGSSSWLVQRATVGTTLTETYTYDGSGLLLHYSVTKTTGGANVYDLQYARDATKNGRVTQKTETIGLAAAQTWTYDYDSFGRLWKATPPGGATNTYTYDGDGNRFGGTYDAQDRLTAFGGASYTYDYNGGRTTKVNGASTTTYAFDMLGALRAVTPPGATKIDYLVDGAGRRVVKRQGSTVKDAFLYGAGDAPVAQLNTDGTIKEVFGYGLHGNVPDLIVKSGTTYRVLTDQLGSVRLVVDTSGNVMQQLAYDEWGNVTTDTSPGFQPFGFAGGLYDRDTGFVRFGAREYDPATGRWVSKDPSLFDGGLNLYVYAENDPVNYIDITGQSPMVLPLAGVGGAGAGGALLAGGWAVAAAGSWYAAYQQAQLLSDEWDSDAFWGTGRFAPDWSPGVPNSCPADFQAEHTKGARPSTEAKHEEGEARRARDQGREKGDDERRPPRKRPPWSRKGPWPPKNPIEPKD